MSDALDALCRLVTPPAAHVEGEGAGEDEPWNPMRLLPPGLFSANPGLLTAEYKQLAPAVRPLFDECPGADDIRCLTSQEMGNPWVLEGVMGLWKDAYGGAQHDDQASTCRPRFSTAESKQRVPALRAVAPLEEEFVRRMWDWVQANVR